mgnify:CR=1 FL=1
MLLVLALALTIWTISVIRNEGIYQQEMKETVSLVLSNSTALIKSIKSLIGILFKDIFIQGNKKPSDSNQENNVTFMSLDSEKETNKEYFNENQILETDSALKDFSPEIIHLIEEEEEKIA